MSSELPTSMSLNTLLGEDVTSPSPSHVANKYASRYLTPDGSSTCVSPLWQSTTSLRPLPIPPQQTSPSAPLFSRSISIRRQAPSNNPRYYRSTAQFGILLSNERRAHVLSWLYDVFKATAQYPWKNLSQGQKFGVSFAGMRPWQGLEVLDAVETSDLWPESPPIGFMRRAATHKPRPSPSMVAPATANLPVSRTQDFSSTQAHIGVDASLSLSLSQSRRLLEKRRQKERQRLRLLGTTAGHDSAAAATGVPLLDSAFPPRDLTRSWLRYCESLRVKVSTSQVASCEGEKSMERIDSQLKSRDGKSEREWSRPGTPVHSLTESKAMQQLQHSRQLSVIIREKKALKPKIEYPGHTQHSLRGQIFGGCMGDGLLSCKGEEDSEVKKTGAGPERNMDENEDDGVKTKERFSFWKRFMRALKNRRKIRGKGGGRPRRRLRRKQGYRI